MQYRSKYKDGYCRTKTGDVLKMSEMTLLHLKNAIAYCDRKGDFKSKQAAEIELKRRFLDQKRECPFCKRTMDMRELFFESGPDEGPDPGLSRTEYRFQCWECKSQGPEESLNKFIEKIS